MGYREKEQWKSKKERDGERDTETYTTRHTNDLTCVRAHTHTHKSPSMKADHHSFV